jgi:hypothetical protein
MWHYPKVTHADGEIWLSATLRFLPYAARPYTHLASRMRH